MQIETLECFLLERLEMLFADVLFLGGQDTH